MAAVPITLGIHWVPLTSLCPGAPRDFAGDPDPSLCIQPQMSDCNGVRGEDEGGDSEWELIDQCLSSEGQHPDHNIIPKGGRLWGCLPWYRGGACFGRAVGGVCSSISEYSTGQTSSFAAASCHSWGTAGEVNALIVNARTCAAAVNRSSSSEYTVSVDFPAPLGYVLRYFFPF
ncbi:predicted protein [Histoplasma capsulatum G186AR]|uniref:Uncharacterized protein n=1 Tax=Ajellomyces capsulatus (strain G186AR / H82 / ATCC MYA-2454 / RMSCC 2432) TaxID=447093 RepID=C0NWX0_AJECG|nr:uncharacterized protein HCBG_07962 [Histoplasma capsulatum G186AR]EEH03836.1 predicted protein [Histoplasma capsulatum G186AR]